FCRFEYKRQFPSHAARGIDDESNADRNILAREVFDLLLGLVLHDSKLLFSEPGDRAVIAIDYCDIHENQFYWNLNRTIALFSALIFPFILGRTFTARRFACSRTQAETKYQHQTKQPPPLETEYRSFHKTTNGSGFIPTGVGKNSMVSVDELMRNSLLRYQC